MYLLDFNTLMTLGVFVGIAVVSIVIALRFIHRPEPHRELVAETSIEDAEGI